MINQNILAPIVVFAYNRVNHLEKTLSALSQNFLAIESDLFIFCDGPKNKNDSLKVNEVHLFLEKFQQTRLFKKISIIKSVTNKGLSRSIIGGVSEIIYQYNKIIVIEDDVVSSKYFLRYMNDCLNAYKDNKHIGSVSSFVSNIKIPKDYYNSVFLSGRPSSIAWGTWVDRWDVIDWDLKNYYYQKFNLLLRLKLNSWGNDVAGRLDRYVAEYNDSWAIRFTVSGIKNKRFSIHPIISLTKHIGYDNSGTNSSADDRKKFSIDLITDKQIKIPDVLPNIDNRIRMEYIEKYRRPFLSSLGEFFLVVIFGLKQNSQIIKFARGLSKKIKKIIE